MSSVAQPLRNHSFRPGPVVIPDYRPQVTPETSPVVRAGKRLTIPHRKLVQFKPAIVRDDQSTNPVQQCSDLVRKSLLEEVTRLEKNVQLAVRKEVSYLTLAEAARNKHDEKRKLLATLTKLYNEMTSPVVRRSLAENMEETRTFMVSHKKTYETCLGKAKSIHAKRYRWTKMIEHSRREFLKMQKGPRPAQGGLPSMLELALPPLAPSNLYLGNMKR